MGYFKSMRDRVDGTIKLQGKEIGSVSTQSESISNSPIDFTGLDSRAIKRYTGNLKVSGRLDKLHDVRVDPNLFELATGHAALNILTDEVKITPDDELSSYWEINQLDDDSVWEVYTDNRYIIQSFIARGNKISHFYLELIKEGTGLTSGIQIEIYTDSGGEPSGSVSNSLVIIPNADIGAKAWHKINYADTPLLPVEVTKGTKYWITVMAVALEGDADNNISVHYNSLTNGYADGQSKYSTNAGGDWSALNYDLAFEVVFLTENKLEFEVKLTDGTVLETTTLKKTSFPSNEFSIVSGELVVDAGSFEAEDISVKVSLL